MNDYMFTFASSVKPCYHVLRVSSVTESNVWLTAIKHIFFESEREEVFHCLSVWILIVDRHYTENWRWRNGMLSSSKRWKVILESMTMGPLKVQLVIYPIIRWLHKLRTIIFVLLQNLGEFLVRIISEPFPSHVMTWKSAYFRNIEESCWKNISARHLSFDWTDCVR